MKKDKNKTCHGSLPFCHKNSPALPFYLKTLWTNTLSPILLIFFPFPDITLDTALFLLPFVTFWKLHSVFAL
jgi:hypothetical protein